VSDREARSRDFGRKLAAALKERAVKSRAEHDLDPRYVMLGAADYLRETAEFQLDPPVDRARTDTEERRN